jgi:hypothetical protein
VFCGSVTGAGWASALALDAGVLGLCGGPPSVADNGLKRKCQSIFVSRKVAEHESSSMLTA